MASVGFFRKFPPIRLRPPRGPMGTNNFKVPPHQKFREKNPVNYWQYLFPPIFTYKNHSFIPLLWFVGKTFGLPHDADFRLAYHSLLRRMITACCFMVTALSSHAALTITDRHNSRVELKSTVGDLPQWAKRRGYQFIGKMLLATRSSLCDKWRLHSCTNIIINAASGKLV